MKINRIKELACVIFGHEWTEERSAMCQEHGVTFDHQVTCGRCGAVEKRTKDFCLHCFELCGYKALQEE